MARSRLSDVLQSHLFWAFDASFSGVPIFNPLFGFSKISAPEITAELETFKDGTFLWNRSVVKGGSVGAVTFERAASSFDSDFYSWIMFTLTGNQDSTGGAVNAAANLIPSNAGVSPRRNLLIVQFTNINVANASDNIIGTGVAAANGALPGLSIGPIQFAERVPARAWLLNNCLPIRYKAGSDFDAMTPSISLQELEVQPESISELILGV